MSRARFVRLGVVGILAGVVSVLAAFRAGPVTAQSADGCEAARCAVQSEVDARCPCTQDHHGQYVSCVAKALRDLDVPKNCRREIVRCAAKSTCGRPESVVCVRGNGRCHVERSAARCEQRHGTVGAGTSCCASCGTVQCCVPTSTGGAFTSPMGAFTCEVLTADECATANGIDEGPGTCTPNPCPTTTSTTAVTTTSTTSTSATTSTSTSTTQPTTRCCVQSSPAGAFDTCTNVSPGTCAGIDIGAGVCDATSCPPPTTSTSTTSTSTTSTATTSTSSSTTTITTSTTASSTTSTTTSTAGAFLGVFV